MDKIHTAPERKGPLTRVYKGAKSKTKGGYFTPAGRAAPKPKKKKGESNSEYFARLNEWEALPRQPLIKMNATGQDAINTFLHEYGHSLDWVEGTGTGGFGNMLHMNSESSQSPAAEAFTALFDAIKGTDDFTDGMAYSQKTWGYKYGKYLKERREVWARTYAQYMAYKLGGKAREDFDKQMAATGTSFKYQNFSWPVFEAEILGKVEDVLAAQGLLVVT